MLLLSSNVNAEDNNINTLNLVPIRDIFEQLNYDVIWNALDKEVDVIKNGEVINFTIKIKNANKDNQMYIINGKSYTELANVEKLGIRYEYLDTNLIYLKNNMRISDTVPNIYSEELSEDELNILNEHKKIKILFFWATWCPYCREYISEIDKVTVLKNLDVDVIAINIDNKENSEKVDTFLKNNLLNITNIKDTGKEIYNLYEPNLIPTTYIIDTDGKVVDIILGSINAHDLIQIFKNK